MATAVRRGSRNKRTSATRHLDRGAFSLMVHGPEFGSGEELVINPDCFPDVKMHDVLEISQPEREHHRLILEVTSLAPVRGKLQISILKEIAAQFGLDTLREVVVQKIDPREMTVDFIELTFKDQFLSRADIWRFKVAMFGKCVFVGKNVESLGVRSQVEALLASNQNVQCGVIGADTKMIVRSRSSRLFWLVQMSTEMWEFAPDGELYYEKLLNRLLRVLISKWNDCSVSHSVTIIAFSRSYYDKNQFPEGYDPTSAPFVDPVRQGFGPGCASADAANGYGPAVHVDPHTGRYYEDFYKVLVMNYGGPDWTHLLTILKNEFAKYHEAHRWRAPDEFIPAEYTLCEHQPHSTSPISPTSSSPTHMDDEVHLSTAQTEQYVKWKTLPHGVPSRSIDGNILEAINVTLNILDKHYMDRDLNRTGQSIVMLTAGSSVFNVNDRLAQITKQRMMDNGVGMDMISLATPPLHVVPLFIFQRNKTGQPSNSSPIGDHSVHRSQYFAGLGRPLDVSVSHAPIGDNGPVCENGTPMKACYSVPHWVNITFLDFDCRCTEPANGVFLASQSAPSFMSHSNNNRLLSHRMYTCECQLKLNQRFLPLPPFRMFDLTCPSEKLAFPVSLLNMMKRTRQRAASSAPMNDRGQSLAVLAGAESNLDFTARRKLSNLSDTISTGSRAVAPDQWQLSKSPDFCFSLSPRLQSLSSGLSASLIVREALQEYDAAVFGPVTGADNGSPKMQHSHSSSVFSPPFTGGEFASVTFNGDSLTLDGLTMTSKQGRWLSASSGLGSSSVVHSLLSPRNTSAAFSRTLRRSSVKRISTAETLMPSESPRSYATRSDVVFPSSRVTGQQGDTAVAKSKSKFFADEVRVLHRALDESPLESHQVSSSVPAPVTLPFTKAALVSNEGSVDVSDRSPKSDFSRARALTSSAGVADQAKHARETPQSSRNNPSRSIVTMRSPTPVCVPNELVMRASPPPVQSGYASFTPSPMELSGSYQKSFLTGNGMHPPMRRNMSDLANSCLWSGNVPTGSHLTGAVSSNWNSSPNEINPFKYSNETVESASARLSSDRRRWTHLFPVSSNQVSAAFGSGSGEDDTKHVYLGPNWKSLTSPAILPLTTDFYPTPKDLYTSYTESFYALTLPSTDTYMFPKYKNHDELLIEMVCQRLASDFQLVATDAGTDVDILRHRVPAGTTSRGPSGESRDATSNTTTYHLSMGHRIHQIIYDAELQAIEVKRYFERASQSQHNEPKVYTYSLWVEKTQSFQPLQQKFYQYPMPEDNWNALDHLLCGYHDEMSDMIKSRRIRFSFPPPASVIAGTELDKATYVARFAKFVEFLQTRVASENGVQEKISVNINMDASRTPDMRHQISTIGYKMCCSTLPSYVRLKSGDTRNEWVMMNLEDTMDVHKSYHFDVRWLACSGIIVDDFISLIKRKAKQAGLEMRRIPEYSCVSFLQIHPLIAPIFLPMAPALTQNTDHEKSLVSVLVNRLDFVLDDERLADTSGIGYGLGLGKEERLSGVGASGYRMQRRSFGTRTTTRSDAHVSERWRKRGYKQYMHRVAPVFLRLIEHGIVWIPSYDYDQLSSDQQVHDLFIEVCALIHTSSTLHDLVTSCCGPEAA